MVIKRIVSKKNIRNITQTPMASLLIVSFYLIINLLLANNQQHKFQYVINTTQDIIQDVTKYIESLINSSHQPIRNHYDGNFSDDITH